MRSYLAFAGWYPIEADHAGFPWALVGQEQQVEFINGRDHLVWKIAEELIGVGIMQGSVEFEKVFGPGISFANDDGAFLPVIGHDGLHRLAESVADLSEFEIKFAWVVLFLRHDDSKLTGLEITPPGQLEPQSECMRWAVPRHHSGVMNTKAPLNRVAES